MSGYVVEQPAPHVIEEIAASAMYAAMSIIDSARRVGSNYSVSMHPQTHGEWKALISMADQEMYPGCVQRHHVSGNLFITRIYINIEDAMKSRIRCIDVFDWL
jgi:hypothetical protein